MKKIIFTLIMLCTTIGAQAQKFALVDMEYILSNIPAYERANEQLNQTSKSWQAEVEALNTKAQTLYKNYQNESVFLSDAQKKEREKKKRLSTSRRSTLAPKVNFIRSVKALLNPFKTRFIMP